MEFTDSGNEPSLKAYTPRVHSFLCGIRFCVITFVLKPLYFVLQFFNKRLAKFKLINVPIVYWINILVFLTSLSLFIPKYNTWYAQARLFTTVVSNIQLFGLADTLAQTLNILVTKESGNAISLDDVYDEDNHEVSLSRANTYNDDPESLGRTSSENSDTYQIYVDYGDDEDEEDLQSLISVSRPFENPGKLFNYYRLGCFMLWGFIISFFQFTWYLILNDLYVDDPKLITVFERVLADQLCYSPVNLCAFFYYSSIVIEHGDKYTFEKKMKKIYLSTLAANYCVWPIVQFVNFLAMPKKFQVPFSSSIGVLWNCFLSYRNASS